MVSRDVVTKIVHTHIDVLPSATLDVRQLVHRHYVAIGEIPCGYLGINLYSAVGRNHFIRQFDSLVNWDALFDDGVVLHKSSVLNMAGREYPL